MVAAAEIIAVAIVVMVISMRRTRPVMMAMTPRMTAALQDLMVHARLPVVGMDFYLKQGGSNVSLGLVSL